MTNGNKNAKQLHPGIICDLCDGPICGRRYKCLICPDYDLCEKCEGTGYHGEHAMIRLATPQTEKPDFMLRSSSSTNRPQPSYGFFPQFLDPSRYFAERKKYYESEYAAPMYFFDPESEQAKKPMSYEEKTALSTAISKLPSTRIKSVVDIITKSEGMVGVDPNELEIDFETLKCATLRELEVFVKACEAAETNRQSANVQFPHRHHHGHKHHRHHYFSKGGCKRERGSGNEGGSGPTAAGNEDQSGPNFIKWQQKMVEKQQKMVDKMEKKCAKQEQHYRDRAFRALHRFDHHHGGGGHGHRHPPSREERSNVGPENNVGGQQNNNGVEYLKQIGQTLQQALLSFGIDCEATVKDRQGNVQGHLPFPNAENLVPPQQNQENLLNPMEHESPAGILERQKLASKNGIGKKRSNREIMLTELEEAIQRADQITNDKMLRKHLDAAGMEKEKKSGKGDGKKSEKKTTSSSFKSQQPTPPPSAESKSPPSEPQRQNPPQPPSIDPSLQAVFQNATKTAIDGLEVASQIVSEIISGFDPTAGEHIKNMSQNLVDGAKNGAENLTDKMLSTPELLQQAKSTAFQSYLEQLQFPPWMAQNPTQNAQPPTNVKENGQFPPSPQMSEQVQNVMAKFRQQEQMKFEMANQQMQTAKNAAEKSKMEEEAKLSRHFSQMNLEEKKLAPTKELMDEQKPQTEEEEIVGKEEENEEIGGRKKMESFSSSDSDVEILNGSEDDEEEDKQNETVEIEPSLPPSFGSGHSSLKRKAPPQDNHLVEMNKALYDSMNMDMDLSTHTALSTLGGIGSSTADGGNQQQKENEVATNNSTRGLSSSRASSISSLHSTSSNSSSSTESSGWMVVKKESFKRLCEFYEKRRRLDSPNGHGDSFIAELEKERQEALKQQQQENVEKKDENGQNNKSEEFPVVPIKTENISVDVEMLKKIQIHEGAKMASATNQPPNVLEEKIVDIDEPPQQQHEVKKEELPKNNGTNGGMPTPQQSSSNNPNSTPSLANFSTLLNANLAELMNTLMHGGERQPPPPPLTQPSQQPAAGQPKVPSFKWNWGAIPMPPPPPHFNPNSMEIPVFDNGYPKHQFNSRSEPVKPMPSAPAVEMEMNGGHEKKQHSNIYPDLLAASVAAAGNGVLDELCTAGEPHHQCLRMATTSRHTRQCRWIHPNPDVVEVVKQLTDMGFDNCNGWLYRLAEQYNCQLDAIFEAIEQDNLHKERQLLADI